MSNNDKQKYEVYRLQVYRELRTREYYKAQAKIYSTKTI